ncbi:MAG: gluconolaconase [Synoicihabitans sp.]
MLSRSFCRPALFLAAALLGWNIGHAVEPALKWETAGFAAPESVAYDAQRDCFYVSNLATRGKDRIPEDGFISKVSRDGRILELKWATGLEDPKGLAVANGRLYVGDTPAMFEIDLETGHIVARHQPEDGGNGAFNDCTADPMGNVYVFSSRLSTVYRLHAGMFEAWKKIDTSVTGGLNGLRAETDRLLLGGWTVKAPNGDEQLGHISTVRFVDKALSRIGTTPVAHVDGLEPDGIGGYTVTDWPDGDVKHVDANGKVSTLMKLVRGTADHEYLIEDRLMIIPSMLEDRIRAFTWAPPLP